MADHGHHHHQHLDRSSLGSREGIRAIKISTFGLALTALVQMAVVVVTGSVALLADSLHNFGDVFTTVGLWIAFVASRRAADRRYTYGFDRFEDLAGIFVVLVIAFSAAVAGWESVRALLDPQPLRDIPATIAAGLIGVVGNELVARYKMKVGEKIHSVALTADGHHSRTDGLASAGVVAGAIGVMAGFPRADAVAALVITAMIIWVLVGAARDVFARVVDKVDPAVVDAIEEAARRVPGVMGVGGMKARWAGRSLFTQLHVEVDPEMSVVAGHAIAEEVRHAVFHDVEGVAQVTVHLDPHLADGASDDHHVGVSHHDTV